MIRNSYLFGFLICLGCGEEQKAVVVENPNLFVVTDFNKADSAWIGCPRIGLRFDKYGMAVPNSALVAGLYTVESPERLKSFENPFAVELFSGGRPLEAQVPVKYSQKLDMYSGKLEVELERPDGIKIAMTCRASQWNFVEFSFTVTNGSFSPIELFWKSDLNSWCEAMKQKLISSGSKIEPKISTSSNLRQAIKPGKSGCVLAQIEMQSTTSSKEGMPMATVYLDGPIEDQRALNSIQWALNLNAGTDGLPLGPFGLTNTKYGGRAFWDSDIWMFPALAIINQQAAASIAEFRLNTAPEAEQLASKWAKESQAQFKVDPKLGLMLMYPWEAGPTGKENAPAESRRQHHITAGVAHMLAQASALGLVDTQESARVQTGCANWLAQRAERDQSGKWAIRGTMSPDEFATNVDNDLYTNVLAESVLRRAFPGRWKVGSFVRPHDKATYLSYDGDRLRSYKQAAALLAIWPAQDSLCETEANAMLARFSGKTTKNGPAMSKCVEALIQARYGSAALALEKWRTSWKTYSQGSLSQFSEAPNGKNSVFLTGVAGCLDAVLFGFLGLRIDDHEPQKKSWKMPLRNGWWMSASPNLPTEWKSVRMEGVSILGKYYDFYFSDHNVDCRERKIGSKDSEKQIMRARDSKTTVK